MPGPVTNVIWQEGIVLGLDALGVRGMDKDQLGNWIPEWDQLLDQAISKLYEKTLPNTSEPSTRDPDAPAKLVMLGDTLFVIWQSPVGADRSLQLRKIAYWTRDLLGNALRHKTLLRGCIGYGQYAEFTPAFRRRVFANDATNMVVGPAVGEVMAWIEEADWMGAFTLPSVSAFVEKLRGGVGFESVFARYDVPLKRGGLASQVWSITWPHWYCEKYDASMGSHVNGREYFLSQLSAFPRGPANQHKYENTLKFFDAYWCIRSADTDGTVG